MKENVLYLFYTIFYLLVPAAFGVTICRIDNTILPNCSSLNPCDWSSASTWTNCGSSFPSSNNYDAVLDTQGLYSVVLNQTDPIAIADLILGANVTTVNSTQTLSVFSALSATPLIITKQGVLVLDNTPNTLTGTTSINLQGYLIWKSGTIAGGDTSSTSVFTASPTSQIDISGDSTDVKTLSRNLISTGKINILNGNSLALTDNKILTANGSLFLENAVTISGGSKSEAIRITGDLSITPQEFTTTFDIITTITKPFSVTKGSVSFLRNVTTGDFSVSDDAIFSFSSGTSVQNVAVAATGTLNWIGGDTFRITKGSFVNNGEVKFESPIVGARFVSAADGFINNIGRLTISKPLTFVAAQVQNSGSINFAGNLILPVLNVTKGDFTGNDITTSANVTSIFALSGGSIATSTVYLRGSVTIASDPTGFVTLDGSQVVLGGSNPASLSYNVHLKNGAELVVSSVSSIQFGTDAAFIVEAEQTGKVTNNGRIQGTASFTGVAVTNNNIIGSVYSPGNQLTLLRIKNNGITDVEGGLKLTETSQIFLDVFGETKKSTIVVDGVFEMAGSLTVRLRAGYDPITSATIQVISYQKKDSVKGSFASLNLDVSTWNNGGNCQATLTHDEAKSQFVVSISGCSTAAPTPGTNKPKSTSKTGTIVIVLLVAFVLALGIGFIAWCKKKYRKKPWDRLKDDRF